MNTDEIRYKFYSPLTEFYGTMYGGIFGKSQLDRVIKIDKRCIYFCKNADAFYYVWGWPGPDVNLYYFKDYGKTWAFDKDAFMTQRDLELK